MADLHHLDNQVDNLKKRGTALPKNPHRARQAANEMHQMPLKQGALREALDRPKENGRNQQQIDDMEENAKLARSMRQSRALKKLSVSNYGGAGGSSDIGAAVPRFYDPLEYWDLSGLPWNIADEGHRHKLHKWMRLYYSTHYLIPILIDIFTRFPLVGMEVKHKDPEIQQFYETLFMDQLNYPEFLVNLGREYWCALPGELVHTKQGVKPVETITTSDEVLTHRGRFRKVLKTSERPYEGGTVTIRPHYGEPFTFTEGHSVLVSRDGQSDWFPIEQIQTSDWLFVPVDSVVESKERINVWETLDLTEWETLEEPSELEYHAVPDRVGWTNSPKKYTSHRRREMAHHIEQGLEPGCILRRNRPWAQVSPLPTEFALSDDLLRLFGLYVAEGCVALGGNSNVKHGQNGDWNETHWSFAADEQHLIQEVQDTVSSHFGLSSSVRDGLGSKTVIVHNIPLAHWFSELFGEGVDNKHFPEWALYLTPDQTAKLLSGYFDGDGHHNQKFLRAATSSQLLARQTERMVRRLGFVSSIYECNAQRHGKPTQWWQIGATNSYTADFAQRLGYDSTGDTDSGTPEMAVWDREGYWVKAFQIEYGSYSGPVYNMAVEEDESYVSSVAVHNCVGEAFPFGSFDEDLGIWEHEELLNPEDIVIEKFPLLNSRQMKVVPPDYLTKLAQNRDPAREYKMLKENYPELIPYLLKNEHIPISEVLLKQVANTVNTWDDHGTPILLRGLRTLIHEEKLLASQDAIAERLYSPLILAKMGVQDLGDGYGAWMPSQDELEIFRDDLDLALSSDFRLMVHHFGLEIENVFGREQMPRLQDDFDWIERRLMQVFGINPSLLSAGSNSQPYASSALQAEFLNQMLRTFQGFLKQHFKERAAVVAEAHQHYDYETKGHTRIPKMEEVVEYDEDGTKKIVEKPKLIDVDLEFSVLDLRDEATERQFMQTMRQMGVPIPDQKMMIGVDDKVGDYIEEYNKELMDKTIAQQEAKLKTYVGLKERKLPIPPDLDAEIQQMLMEESGMGMAQQQAQQGQPGGAGGGAPGGGGGAPGPPGAGPGRQPGSPIVMPPPPPGVGAPGEQGLGPGGAGNPVPGGGPPPAGPQQPGPPGAAPDISMERRPGQPRPASTNGNQRDSNAQKAKNLLEWYERGYKRGSRKSEEKPKSEPDQSDRSVRLGGVERYEDRVVDTLPKIKKPKRYSIIDWEADDFESDGSGEPDEPSGSSSGDDQ